MRRTWQIPRWLYPFFPGVLFRSKDTAIHLSFDDGPDPGSTVSILDLLKEREWRAIFFVTGERAERYPELVQRIRHEGHQIGNHGYRHLDGWRSRTDEFMKNVYRGEELTSTKLFRPPYGHISPLIYRRIRKEFRVIMWDLMTYDFDPKLGREKRHEQILQRIGPGSIIVLHDKPDCLRSTMEDLEIIGKWCSSTRTPVKEIL